MKLLIGGEKGGTGKTTLALCLASYLASNGKKVVVLDTDVQKSALVWLEIRDPALPKIDVFPEYGQIQDAVERYVPEYDHVLIDAGGRDSVELRSAIIGADVFLTPIQASQFDLASLSRLHKIVEKAKTFNPGLRALVCINRGSTNPKVNDTAEAATFISYYNLFRIAAVIKDRAAFRKVGYTGTGIHELSKKDYNPLAFREIQHLSREVFNEV